MPSNILQADVGFPELTEEQTTDEKFQLVTNYLFMLREQLRYSLSNLDTNNFSTGGIDGLTKLITEPIYAQLEDEDGNFAAITAMADGLGVRIGNAEGQLTQLTATVNGIRLTATNGSTSSQLGLTIGGVQIEGPTISMNGLVAFTNLSSDYSTSGDTTIINGGHIRSGTINANLVNVTNLNAANITSGDIAADRIQTAAVSIIGNTVTAAYVNALGISTAYLRAGGDSDANFMYVTDTGFTLYNNSTVRALMSYSGSQVSLRLGNSNYAYFQKFYETANLYGAWMGDGSYYTGVMADFQKHQVRIKVGTGGRYWLFKTSGIDYCDSDGSVLNSVSLQS